MLKHVSKWYPDFRQYGSSPVDRYYVAGHVAGNLASGTLGADSLYAVPLVMPYKTRLDRVGVRVLGGAGGAVRIGVYTALSTIDLTPSVLLFDSGEIDTGSNGHAVRPVNWLLDGDTLYWMVINGNNGSLTIRTIPVAGTYPILGYDNTVEAGSASAGMGWAGTHAFGALPATFPAATVYPASSGLPAITYRLAA